MFFFLILYLSDSIKYEVIPKTRAPPDDFFNAGSAYDSETNSLLFFGMRNSILNKYENTLFTFNLDTFQWSSIKPQSNFIPEPLGCNYLYLRKDRILLSILGCNDKGYINDVYSFNLTSKSWKTHTIHNIEAICYFSAISFNYKSQDLIAILGGFSENGISDKLYFFDVWTLEFREMRQFGKEKIYSVSEAITYLDGKIYLFGSGADFMRGKITDLSAGVKVYDIESEQWEINFSNETNTKFLLYNHNFFNIGNRFYLYGGYNPIDNRVNNFLHEINVTTAELTSLFDFGDEATGFNSIFVFNDSIIIAGGRGYYENTNHIIKISLPNISVETLSPQFISPQPRKGQAMFSYSHFLYIYGGETELEYLNDIWRFDLFSMTWSALSPTGSIPDPKIGFSAIEYFDMGIIIFAGKGTTWYSDLHFYSFSANTWTLISMSGDSLGPRRGSCIVIWREPYVVIIGGLTPSGSSNEVRIIDLILGIFYNVKWTGRTTISLLNHACIAYNIQNDTVMIRVFGGETSPMNQNKYVYALKIVKSDDEFYCSVTEEDYDEYLVISKSNQDYISFGNTSLIFFGSYFGLISSKSVSIMDVPTKTYSSLSFNSYFHSHSAIHYNRSIYIFGGCNTENSLYFEKCFTNNLIKIDFEPEDNFTLPCSNSFIQETCELCPAGTFLKNNFCTPCGKGKFSTTIGLISQVSCIPCEYGTYSDQLQAIRCRDCEYGLVCYIGSQRPKLISEFIEKSSSQPSSYKSNYQDISDFLNTSIALLSVFIFISCAAFYRFRQAIVKFDLFMMQHPNELNKPMIFRKTKIGGLFSLVFILYSIYSVIGSFYMFIIDNVYESKGLVPLDTLNKVIISDYLAIIIKFEYYGGSCSQPDKYYPKIVIIEEKLIYKYKTTTFNKFEETCTINLTYFDTQIDELSTISITSLEDEAYCSIISINVTSPSSIPGELSSVFQSLKSSSNYKVFRGYDPSIFQFMVNPSLFVSESRLWPDGTTGFHISDSGSHTLGSLQSQKYIITNPTLKAMIKLTPSLNSLVTQRKLKFTWFLFYTYVLGSIFGLMQLVGILMSYTETLWQIKKRRTSQNRKFKKIVISNQLIQVNFDYRKQVKSKPSYFESFISQTIDSSS